MTTQIYIFDRQEMVDENNYEFYKKFIEIFLEKYTGSKNIDIIRSKGAKYTVVALP